MPHPLTDEPSRLCDNLFKHILIEAVRLGTEHFNELRGRTMHLVGLEPVQLHLVHFTPTPQLDEGHRR